MQHGWDRYDMRINMLMRRDIKEAMEVLRARRSRKAGGYISLGRLFGEAGLMLLKREGIPVLVEEEDDPAAPKPPSSTGRKRRETAVA